MEENKSVKLLLPRTAPALCFNKEQFIKDDFNVDHFVVEGRRQVSLEVLRTDLHLYLKILQNAMIELINKDYADFLNLSTNLVGMDKSINHLIQPLNLIKKDISELNDTAKEKLKLIEEKLKVKAVIKEKREGLQNLAQIIKTMHNIESLQGIPTNQISHSTYSSTNHIASTYTRGSDEGVGVSKSQSMERLSSEFNCLEVHLRNSHQCKLSSDLAPRVQSIRDHLGVSLETSIRECFITNDKPELLILLRSYATIGRPDEAECIFREHVVKDYMQAIIQESVLRERGLAGMYDQVLQFMPLHCSTIKQLTAGSEDSVSGYDMLVNAVWPEVVHHILFNTPSIFAPGNPEVFHQSYSTSMHFLRRFERCLSSVASVKRLRCHPSYTSFQAKWGLSIYFQIRFQEVAGRLESSLMTPFQVNQLVPPDDDAIVSKDTVTWEIKASEHAPLRELHKCKFQCSATLCECLSSCWSAGVFLDVLLHRFWKLSLQLCARYATWLRELSNQLSATKRLKNPVLRNEATKPSTTPSLPPPSDATTPHWLSNGEDANKEPLNLQNCISTLSDIRTLISAMERIFEQEISPTICKRKGVDMQIIKDAWRDGERAFEEHIPALVQFISSDVIHVCLPSLKAVHNIPRLFKRTNRETPTKASPYIASLMAPLTQFTQLHGTTIHPSDLQAILTNALCTVSEQYQSIIVEVLNSLRRMEESLKRLKAARQTNSGGVGGSSNQGVSDDDKIKMQLSIDVQQFIAQASNLAVNPAQLNSSLAQLKQVVVTDI